MIKAVSYFMYMSYEGRYSEVVETEDMLVGERESELISGCRRRFKTLTAGQRRG